MRIVNFAAKVRPSLTMLRMRKHLGNLSEGDRSECFAERQILGARCKFFRSGEHTVALEGIDPIEMQDSVLLRYAHASIIANEPVGDKAVLCVDARQHKVTVWINNVPIKSFMEYAKKAIRSGAVSRELVCDDNPIPKLKELMTCQK